MTEPARVLVVGRPSETANQVVATLERRGYAAIVCREPDQAATVLRAQRAGAVVVVPPIAPTDAEALLAAVVGMAPSPPLILTGVAGLPAAMLDRALTRDVGDDPGKLLAAVGAALASRKDDLRERPGKPFDWDAIVSNCVPMKRVLEQARQICSRTARGSAATVLITGETGTGKGLLAKCIHHNGVRKNQPLVDVNCAAIPPSLIETELFGHERGAFTDAKTSRVGFFEAANKGTLFLDEIPSVPLHLQAKLLTAIEDKQIRRIGGRPSIGVDVQIIAGAHTALGRLVEQRAFRDDLYHRLNVLHLRLPPLRERGEDKIQLAEAFVAASCREYGLGARVLSEDARRFIMSYHWPGNVRELKNQLARIVLMENEDIIRAHHFQCDDGRSTLQVESDDRGRVRVRIPSGGVSLEAVERELLRQAVFTCEGNISRAARFLGISRQTLIYRLKKHGITERDYTSEPPPPSAAVRSVAPSAPSAPPPSIPAISSRAPSTPTHRTPSTPTARSPVSPSMAPAPDTERTPGIVPGDAAQRDAS